MKRMVIVIPSYNNRQWYRQNLRSLCAQKYDHFRAIYVDDGSTDQTGALVEQFLADQAVGPRIQVIRNPVRVGALENLYRSIHACDDQEIVILLDGDDWLAHSRVLQILNTVYADPDCWMTYGQYASWPVPVLGYSRPIPARITDTMHGCLNGSIGRISSARGARSTPWPGTKPSCFRCWKWPGTGRSSFLTSCIRITPQIRSMTPRSTVVCNNNAKRRSAVNNDMNACRRALACFRD
jgi:glycosyltransferase involved in cell wall biosynthesis